MQHPTSYPPPPPGWPEGAKEHMWTPFWLTKSVLVMFAAWFASMALATGLLYHFSLEHNGISAQKEANHYGWKYGPTALLVVVGALWKQVDHQNKILMPWKELQQGPAPVSKTLLLDYISPILPTALWAAIKNRHWAVVMSTVGHLLILGTTIFSTGLLILESTQVTKESNDFSVKGQFKIDDPENDQGLKIGPAASQLYYGIHFQGLDYPTGTSEDTLLPLFQLPDHTDSDLNYTVTTEGMKIDLDCEVLPITNGTQTSMPWYSVLGSFFVANITTPECNISGITVGVGPDHNYYHQPNASQNYQGQFKVYPCNIDWDFSTQYIESADTPEYDMVYNTSADQRVVLSMADLRFSPSKSSGTAPRYIYVNELKVALCKPSYNLQPFRVQSSSVLNGTSQAVLSSAASPSEKLVKGLPASTLAMGVYRSAGLFYLGTGGDDYVLSEQVPTFFQLMSMLNSNSPLSSFLDPQLLVETGKSVFKGIATQALRQLVLKPADQQLAGSITYTEDRLHVKSLSTGFICTFLAILTLLAIGMLFVRPHSVIPREPGSIAATATMLAASPPLQQTVMYMGTSRRSQIRKRLEAFNFRSAIIPGPQPTLMIEPIPHSKEASLEGPEPAEQAISWWRPMSGYPWFLALAIGLPLLLIVALEIVQHFSDKNSGFMKIGPSDVAAFATYIPAAVVLGVASMYTALELMAAVFAPYDALRRGKASADRSIHLNLVGKLLPHAAFLSLKTRHFAVLVALAANFVGGFLTIVVSGLYSVVDIPHVAELTIYQADTFNLNDVDISLEDGQASAIDSLIEYLDLSYPQWTYEGLTFNRFRVRDAAVSSSSSQAPLVVEVPATRASLNCTTIPSESRQVSIIYGDQDGNSMSSLPGGSSFYSPRPGYIYAGFNTTLDYSEWCETPPSENSTAAFWMQYFWLPYDLSPAYVGKASIIQWSSSGILADGALDTDPTSGTGMGVNGLTTGGFGCPTFAVTLGSARATERNRVGNTTEWDFEHDFGTLLCYQNIEEVNTNLTWTLPGFDLAGASTPKPDESTAKTLKTSSGSERFEFAPNAWLLGLSDSVFNRTIAGPDNSSYLYNDVDSFVRALVYGKNGQPLDELLGSNNTDNLTTISNDLYKAYMAQAISLNMRKNNTAADSKLPSFTGTLSTTGHQRLRQNRPSKIALQVMLALMVACAVGMTLLIRIREVLPHNPCSIAGTATLLAGSEMASTRIIPPCAEWRNDKELKILGVFEQYVYALTWWVEYGGDRSSKQRYGVDLDKQVG
ncbi:hypothetical protein EDB81DRAFT_655305 [Dactylonectria macrodidyma]|uniref:Uncharacterized protein n=1 Tax=Dactylonectria macrodidyma TaxID=307937 RepID=A0A9P9EPD7_9HYPO|nr:hypothetical protein EDB81DRAFT_655305 [Dactylonectria macrodidyma]